MTGEEWQNARSVLDSMRRIVRGLRVWVRTCEKSTSLGGAQFFVLQRLVSSGPVSINDLATHTLTDQSTVSVLVKRLVERNLAERRPSPRDARKVLVHITPAGRELVSKAPCSPQERIIQAVLALSRADGRKLAQLLKSIVSETELDAGPPGLIYEEKQGHIRRKESSHRRQKERIYANSYSEPR